MNDPTELDLLHAAWTRSFDNLLEQMTQLKEARAQYRTAHFSMSNAAQIKMAEAFKTFHTAFATMARIEDAMTKYRISEEQLQVAAD